MRKFLQIPQFLRDKKLNISGTLGALVFLSFGSAKIRNSIRNTKKRGCSVQKSVKESRWSVKK